MCIIQIGMYHNDIMTCRCHGIAIRRSKELLHQITNSHLDGLGLSQVRSEQLINIYDEYFGLGYGKNKPHEIGML